MNTDLKSSQFKFAFTGTNCSGKTTMALDITARLKAEQNVLAEVVSSQDRKITWKDGHFPVDPRAHYGMITNLIHAEVQAELKGDADVVVTDRSVLDLFAIASYDHPDSPMIRGLTSMIKAWLTTYTRIYYLAPLPYQHDGKRPDDDFRMKTHARLQVLMTGWDLPNLVQMERPDIYKDIKQILGVNVPHADFAEAEKWTALCNTLQVPIVVKEQKSKISSDLDWWMFYTPNSITDPVDTLVKHAETLAKAYFGRDMPVMLAPNHALAKVESLGPHRLYVPETLRTSCLNFAVRPVSLS